MSTLVTHSTILKTTFFGEGCTFLNNKVYQLTYREGKVIIYTSDLSNVATVAMPNEMAEGWGMTNDGTHLIASDGTNTIFFLNPDSRKINRTIGVTNDGKALNYINELEYVNGYIYANVLPLSIIVKIDPSNGNVVKRYDFSDLYNDA